MTPSYPPCTLHQITQHVWWFTPEDHTDRPSLCAVVGVNHVVLLDIGASVAHTNQFLDALASRNIKSPDYAILTHWHWDHVFGIDTLDCTVIAHRETAQNIERMMLLDYSNANLPTLIAEGHEVAFTQEHMMIELTDTQRQNLVLRSPDITFDSAMQLDLGGVTCQIQHVGGDHASDAVVIYIPEDSLLFMGDCFYYTVYQEPQHFTQAKLLPLIDKLESFNAQTYVIGHADELYSQEEMQEEFALIRDCYRLLDQHGTTQEATIKAELSERYDTEEVDYYWQSIVAGIKIAVNPKH